MLQRWNATSKVDGLISTVWEKYRPTGFMSLFWSTYGSVFLKKKQSFLPSHKKQLSSETNQAVVLDCSVAVFKDIAWFERKKLVFFFAKKDL